jgi:hypothetical protein
MPSFLTDPKMIGMLFLGLAGITATIIGVYLIAFRWRGRRPVPYCISAGMLYALLFVATLEHALINTGVESDIAGSSLITLLLLGQALVTSVGVGVFVLLIFGVYLAMLGPLEFPTKRINSYAGAAVFIFVISILINPVDAVRITNDPASRSLYVTALATPTPAILEAAGTKADRTLSQLREIGALTRIEAGKGKLVHHVRGQFLDLPNDVVKEYMRAALFHHIHFDGGTIKPVILQVADTNREIASLLPNGRFRRSRATDVQISSLPAPPGQ